MRTAHGKAAVGLLLAAWACGDTLDVMSTPSGTITVSGPASARQGDVVMYGAEVRDTSGTLVTDSAIVWSVSPLGAGFIAADGRFVGYQAGAARVIARAGSLADSVTVVIQLRGLGGSLTVEGRGTIADRFTSDLWVHGIAAYTGTWSTRTEPGNTVYVWRIDDPTRPALTDSLRLDASTVNDIKVRSDGTVGVATHEGSSDGLNGITLLDLADPLHPAVIGRYTSGLGSGVHNVWIDGDYVYVAPDGVGVGLRIVDISDPNNPTEAAQFTGGSSFLHDVYVRDGLAFLSHWNDGLVIVDVGNGIAGGSPSSPTEVSRIAAIGGQTHNAWYWPAAGYVFVGEEDFGAPGILHVVDVRDLRQPREVATYAVPGGPPHNFWLDEAGGVLYAAWYGQGLRGVDVSGELLGRLELQGRAIASSLYGGSGACPSATGSFTCTWAPQLEAGLVFVSDMNTGLTVLRPQF